MLQEFLALTPKDFLVVGSGRLAYWRLGELAYYDRLSQDQSNLNTNHNIELDYYREGLALECKAIAAEKPENESRWNQQVQIVRETEDPQILLDIALQSLEHRFDNRIYCFLLTYIRKLILLTQWMIDNGYANESLPALQRIYDIQTNHMTAENIDFTLEKSIAWTKSTIGGCYIAMNQFPLAEKNLLDSHHQLHDNSGQHDPLTIITTHRLIQLYEKWNQPEKATALRSTLKDSTIPVPHPVFNCN